MKLLKKHLIPRSATIYAPATSVCGVYNPRSFTLLSSRVTCGRCLHWIKKHG
jgi:hypothetical protein